MYEKKLTSFIIIPLQNDTKLDDNPLSTHSISLFLVMNKSFMLISNIFSNNLHQSFNIELKMEKKTKSHEEEYYK